MRLALVAAVLIFSVPALAFENTYRPRQRRECRMSRNGSWSRSEARDVERCIARRFRRVRVAKMLRVAYCESRHLATARSSSGRYRGLYQHDKDRWLARYRWARRALRRTLGGHVSRGIYNARTNAGVTAVMVKRSGWAAWSCA